MSTESAETNIGHLFGNHNAAPSAEQAIPQPSEQPLPPDVAESYQQPSSEAIFQQPLPAAVPGQEPQGQPPQQQPHQVPLSELIEERKRRQSAEEFQRNQQRRIDQLEQTMARLTQPPPPPQPVIDPYEDPNGFAQNLMQAVDQRFLNMTLNESERRARSEHGAEAVDAAFEAAQRSGFAQAFVNKPDAYGEMVRWYKAQQVAETIGADPNAYRQRLEQEVRAKVLAEMRQGTPPPSNIPPSLSQATRASPQYHTEVVGSDKDFFNEMMNRKRG